MDVKQIMLIVVLIALVVVALLLAFTGSGSKTPAENARLDTGPLGGPRTGSTIDLTNSAPTRPIITGEGAGEAMPAFPREGAHPDSESALPAPAEGTKDENWFFRRDAAHRDPSAESTWDDLQPPTAEENAASAAAAAERQAEHSPIGVIDPVEDDLLPVVAEQEPETEVIDGDLVDGAEVEDAPERAEAESASIDEELDASEGAALDAQVEDAPVAESDEPIADDAQPESSEVVELDDTEHADTELDHDVNVPNEVESDAQAELADEAVLDDEAVEPALVETPDESVAEAEPTIDAEVADTDLESESELLEDEVADEPVSTKLAAVPTPSLADEIDAEVVDEVALDDDGFIPASRPTYSHLDAALRPRARRFSA